MHIKKPISALLVLALTSTTSAYAQSPLHEEELQNVQSLSSSGGGDTSSFEDDDLLDVAIPEYVPEENTEGESQVDTTSAPVSSTVQSVASTTQAHETVNQVVGQDTNRVDLPGTPGQSVASIPHVETQETVNQVVGQDTNRVDLPETPGQSVASILHVETQETASQKTAPVNLTHIPTVSSEASPSTLTHGTTPLVPAQDASSPAVKENADTGLLKRQQDVSTAWSAVGYDLGLAGIVAYTGGTVLALIPSAPAAAVGAAAAGVGYGMCWYAPDGVVCSAATSVLNTFAPEALRNGALLDTEAYSWWNVADAAGGAAWAGVEAGVTHGAGKAITWAGKTRLGTAVKNGAAAMPGKVRQFGSSVGKKVFYTTTTTPGKPPYSTFNIGAPGAVDEICGIINGQGLAAGWKRQAKSALTSLPDLTQVTLQQVKDTLAHAVDGTVPGSPAKISGKQAFQAALDGVTRDSLVALRHVAETQHAGVVPVVKTAFSPARAWAIGTLGMGTIGGGLLLDTDNLAAKWQGQPSPTNTTLFHDAAASYKLGVAKDGVVALGTTVLTSVQATADANSAIREAFTAHEGSEMRNGLTRIGHTIEEETGVFAGVKSGARRFANLVNAWVIEPISSLSKHLTFTGASQGAAGAAAVTMVASDSSSSQQQQNVAMDPALTGGNGKKND